ncbi:F-box only protein 43 [Takifugu flavidus]|uniref:F-box only protein 43 n=1 Tax=Takifugu flavidus TaxID=433684 RepID=UPI002544AE03|nr:F-box only protein 43 [Takifugu flavidus]XP_056901433.1 F-box only protein 43 [Takifugu flavidus]XP_056901434.1 F-box only protein 43 [Takifugu flavidus]
MQCTPESNIYLQSCKGQQSYDCSDSGYSGLFRSPPSAAGADSCKSLSPEECGGTSKENLRPSVTPSWCETPRRDSSLRQRRLICRLTQPVKADIRSPCSSGTDASLGWLSFSFDSIDGDTGPLDPAQDLPLSCRKRRLLFTQTRTSTLDDGKLNSAQLSSFGSRISLSDAEFSENLSAADQRETPIFNKLLPGSSKRSFRSPIGSVATDLYDDTSALCTPSSTHTPKFIRSACEDSGFSSLTLDKDSPVDYDGSFQELLLSASRGHAETPNLAESKRRSRLHRQNRLSTLKEGGSQSEEDLADRRHARSHQTCSHSKDDEVFAENAPPHAAISADGLAPGRPFYTTPLRATRARPENATLRGTSAVPDETPHRRRTSVNLSLTPALQLVHAMCQQKAQMFTGHSPSLKEQLRYTAALTETPVMFRTSLPLAGLIGRKMGLGKVDILTELKKRNLRHVLSIILGELSPESVYRCGQVCKSWSEVVQQDEGACLKRRTHLMEVDAGLESGGAHHVPEAETRLTLLKRSALKSVQAQSRSSSFCTPQSAKSTLTPLQHSGSSKRDKFIEVAKTLFNDECLKPCPRCQHPARCHSVKGEGICSRADCGFQFCTACLCTFHGSRECGSQSVGRHNKDKLLPGSAQSKRNVRRL